jgi:hypothetical protein
MPTICLYGQSEPADPFNLKYENLRLDTMAHSLSMLNRYTGHTIFPYSVAQHSWLMASIVPAHLKKCALIHDWSEAFTNDVAYPVKLELPEYRAMEDTIQRRIFELMDVPFFLMEELKDFDRRICVNEMEVLMPGRKPYAVERPRLDGIKIYHYDWEAMKITYLKVLKKAFNDHILLH